MEIRALRELAFEWTYLNYTHFRQAMRPPVLDLHDGGSRLGTWDRHVRSLSLSRQLVLQQPWGVTAEVLKHEMAHQYVDEVLHVHDEPAHGPAFQRVCVQLAINPAASGLPDATGAGAPPSRIIERIQKLLALADSPNSNEAQAAMNAAQRLMLKHNINVSGQPGGGHYGFRQVGPVKKAFFAHEKLVAGILSQHFFVQTIWVKAFDPPRFRWGRVLELHGTPENLEMACYVHEFLHQSALRLWKAHQREAGLRDGRQRNRYLAGVMMGFREKLLQQQRRCRQEGLVWVGDADLDTYVNRRYANLVMSRAYQVRTGQAWQQGREAGKDIVLHRPIAKHDGQADKLLEDTRGR